MKKKKNIILIIMIVLAGLGIILMIVNAKNNMNNTLMVNLYKVIIVLFSIILSISLLYLIMNKINNKFYMKRDKLIIYILFNIIVISLVSIISCYIINSFRFDKIKMIENNSKDKIVLDKSNVISDNKIDLSLYDGDITIVDGGSYTLSGKLEHALIVDSDDTVELIFDNVIINNRDTAAIIGLSSKGKIIINLLEDTINKLSDGGNTEYDGCIYSRSSLEFRGMGTLIVDGMQIDGEGIATENNDITFNSGNYIITSVDDGINAGGDGGLITINDGTFYIDASGDGIDSNKNAIINGGNLFIMGSDTSGDAGIDTDLGYEINGGRVIALGSDMIELPSNETKQNVLAFTLDNKINKDTVVSLIKDDFVVVSFSASKSFKTIIISMSSLVNGEYSLYVGGNNTGNLVNGVYEDGEYGGGTLVSIGNNMLFEVKDTINYYK